MRKFGRIGLWLVVLVMAVTAVACPALADFDLNRGGSVTVRIHTAAEKNVKNANIRLYRVGEATTEDYNLKFVPTGAFADCGVDLSNLSDGDMAAALAQYAKDNGITPDMTGKTDKNGVVSFAVEQSGMYLVVQKGFSNKSSAKYSEIQPFVVTIPMINENGTDWVYDIEAQPKVNPLPTPKPTKKPTDLPEGNLPQTGMLRWPVPVLGVGGLVLFSVGWALFFGKKKADKDA